MDLFSSCFTIIIFTMCSSDACYLERIATHTVPFSPTQITVKTFTENLNKLETKYFLEVEKFKVLVSRTGRFLFCT